MVGLSLVVVAFLSLSTPARAQSGAADPYVMEDEGYGGVSDDFSPYGGFGLEYSQPVRAGGLIMDRFGMLYRTPEVAPERSVAAPPARARQARTGSSRVTARPRYQLPTGSLYWPAASGVILYSPAMRYQSYGAGYGRGPYGSVDHGMMYKGWPLAY